MTSQLLGPNGEPIKSSHFTNKKAKPPALGEGFGSWAENDVHFMTLPGGGVVQFDLSKLTLADFRAMRDHYQINSSLAVQAFMQHQSDWHIECDDKRIAEHCETNLREIWTSLNRALATANWAGYSPNALNWDNDVNKRSIVLSKVKDLIPETCAVKWDLVEGWAPPEVKVKPKHKVYGGIRQVGSPFPIPVENSLWYPLLMENGDYYGRKLLRPAFTSWFFSILLHLFANRYYERFGEPTPIGRAPFEDDIEIGGERKRGNEYLLGVLMNLRNRGAVVLPNDATQDSSGKMNFDYQIEYLESQMRGADFERYMTRLDEEMSIGLFTPILLLRTADVGSYNLGTAHMQMYMWMLNAMNDDRAQYINKYVLNKMVNYNFSEKAPRAKIVFRKLGNANGELFRDILIGLVSQGKVKVDIKELGQMSGMTLEEVNETLSETSDGDDDDFEEPGGGTGGDGPDAPPGGGRKADGKITLPGRALTTVQAINQRVRPQIENAFREGRFGPGLKLTMGYKRTFENDLQSFGVDDPIVKTARIYSFMDAWIADTLEISSSIATAAEFMKLFEAVLGNYTDDVLSS